MKVYISSSWRQRARVRECADLLRGRGHLAYDFTDPFSRAEFLGQGPVAVAAEIPPEKFPEQFDPEVHRYADYITRPEWVTAVMTNRAALGRCDAVILILPCGNDAHADAFYGLGLGRTLVVCGHPGRGERTPTHNWADAIVDDIGQAVAVVDLVFRRQRP